MSPVPRANVILDVSYSEPTGGEIGFVTLYAISAGGDDDGKGFGSAFFSVGDVGFKSGSWSDQYLTNPLLFDVGGFYRCYFFERSVLINPYVTIRGSGELLTWAYRDDVVIGDTTIGSDGVWGFAGEAGLGVAVNRANGLAVFAEISAGGRFFSESTLREFENDVFDSHGYWSVRGGVQYSFQAGCRHSRILAARMEFRDCP